VRQLPEIPDGFRYATHVSVFHREEGEAVGRYRQLMAVPGDVCCLYQLKDNAVQESIRGA
jgi:hypothetical protein